MASALKGALGALSVLKAPFMARPASWKRLSWHGQRPERAFQGGRTPSWVAGHCRPGHQPHLRSPPLPGYRGVTRQCRARVVMEVPEYLCS